MGLLLSGPVQAQGRQEVLDAGQIGQRLDRLAVLGNVLYIAAHPDDENTQLLAWLSQQRHYRTAYLSLTRGDGGQNLIGQEQGENLGLIRTHELLEARKIDGAEQLFSRANDFGFSKTSSETLQVWDKEQVLADVVWAIRRFQPDVIITRFPGDSRAGHGHHQASSLLAQEAFSAAADPARFPEQLQRVQPWQAKRLLWNTWKSFLGSGDTTAADQLKVDIGGYNPLLGQSYGEIAALSRDQHKSQGFGSAAQRGRHWESFALLAGAPARQDLFDGIDTGWGRLPGTQAVARQVQRLRERFNGAAPQDSVPALLQLRQQLQALPVCPWRERKLQEVQELVLATAGVWVESTAVHAQYPVGTDIAVTTRVLLRSHVPVTVLQDGQARRLNQDEPFDAGTHVAAQRISQPYWLSKAHDQGLFRVDDQQQIGKPMLAHAPVVVTRLQVAGQPFDVQREIQYKAVDPVRGEVYRPVQVTPPVTVTPSDSVLLFGDAKARRVEVRVQGFVDNLQGVLRPAVPRGWTVNPEQIPFRLAHSADETTLAFELSPAANTENGTLQLQAEVAGQRYEQALSRIDYPHIPRQDWFPPATAALVKFDLQRASERIGYISGPGDRLPALLRQLGYQVEELDPASLAQRPLAGFDAIVTGARAWNIHPQLAGLRDTLLGYVQDGGVLLVQYNTLSPLPRTPLGPYPFTISRDRVTEQDARVSLLLPAHALLNHPNRITEADFQGWVQERGLYFARDIDPRYEQLLGMHDQGEAQLTGGLISAQVGKGRFTYAPLSFFRQLPAGVPGAARLLANLLAK